MFEPRMLARKEALLRDPSGGQPNLAAAPGTWFEFGPAFPDEVIDIGSIGVVCSGEALLSHLESFGGEEAKLEIAVDIDDGYGRIRDLAALAPHHIDSAADWQEGRFERAFLDFNAGRIADGSDRTALRGRDQNGMGSAPSPARWTSAPIDLRYGDQIAAVSWEIWPAGDPAGNAVAPPTISMRFGSRQGGGIDWQAPVTIAQTAADIAEGHVDFDAALAGDVYEWTVELPYIQPGVAGRGDQPVLRTATVFNLCTWVRLRHSRYRFDSIAELLDRAELSRHVASRGFGGGDDGLVFRVPLAVLLRGRFGERIRARIKGPGAGKFKILELNVNGDLSFDRSGS